MYTMGDMTHINIVVHNLEEGSSAAAHNFNSLAESSFVEGLADVARVNDTHSIVRPVWQVALNSALHGDATVEDDINKMGSDRCEGRVFSERVTGEGRVACDKTLGAHVIEGGLLSNDQCNLGKLGGE